MPHLSTTATCLRASGCTRSARFAWSGTPIERWGGDKAGSRQAQGLFAFLYDRGERGVAKDEVLELIWPDADPNAPTSHSTGR
jgi:two-component SAPR family response regulator